jgi:hypothetical protein
MIRHSRNGLLRILFTYFFGMLSIVQGEIHTRVSIFPASIKALPSSIISFDVRVDSIENLFAASTKIAFDRTILQFVSIQQGAFLSGNNVNGLFLGLIVQPLPPASPNTLTIDQAIFGSTPVSGSGILFTIVFKTLRKGLSHVTLTAVDFRERSNKPIPARMNSGTIIVNTPPAAVQLLYPSAGTVIDTSMNVKLVWSQSADDDNGDHVSYRIHIKSASSHFLLENLLDTTFAMTKELLQPNTIYTWSVDATDGMDTVPSIQQFHFKTPLIRYPAENPVLFSVEQNYPNPFHQSTLIRFSVPFATHVNITVFDIAGREINRLLEDDLDAGYYLTAWDAKNSRGTQVSSGVYLYKVSSGRMKEVRKMIFLK